MLDSFKCVWISKSTADLMFDVQDLDLDYVAAVANLFVGPGTLPDELSGQDLGRFIYWEIVADFNKEIFSVKRFEHSRDRV